MLAIEHRGIDEQSYTIFRQPKFVHILSAVVNKTSAHKFWKNTFETGLNRIGVRRIRGIDGLWQRATHQIVRSGCTIRIQRLAASAESNQSLPGIDFCAVNISAMEHQAFYFRCGWKLVAKDNRQSFQLITLLT